MSHRFSLARFRWSATATLVGLACATALISCSSPPNSQSSTPPSNPSPPLSTAPDEGSISEASPDAPSDGESAGTDSVSTSTSEKSVGETESAPTEAVVSDAQVEDSQLDDNPPEPDPELEPESESTDTNADPVLSDAVADSQSESETDSESSEPQAANTERAADAEDSTQTAAATSDDDVETERGDRAWRLIQNRGRLRVGLDPTIGYTYLRADTDRRTFEGFEWDILQAIAQELDVDIEPVYIPWDNQLVALETQSVDVIVGGRDALGVDETRFIPTNPYYSSPQRIVVRAELSTEIRHLSDLFGRKVGTVADSAGAAVVEVFNQERANALTLLSSPNPSHLFEQLRESQVDAIVIDQPVAVAEAEIVEAVTLDEDGSSDGGEVSTSNDAELDAAERGADAELDRIGPIAVEPAVSSSAQPDLVSEASREDITGEDSEIGSDSIGNEVDAIGDGTTANVNLHIVGEPMFPTPLVGVVTTENISIKQAIDEAIATLDQNGTLTTILEKWEL